MTRNGKPKWPAWILFAAGLASGMLFFPTVGHWGLGVGSARRFLLARQQYFEEEAAAAQRAAVCMPEDPLRGDDAARAEREEYQAKIMADAAQWNVEVMDWAGYAGPWIENSFLEHWKAAKEAGVEMGDRLYVPLMYCDCFHHCSKQQKQLLQGFLSTLKTQYRYFSVTQLDKGLQYSEISVPPGLDLLLFSSGSTTRGARTVPLPLLKAVLAPAGLPKDINVSFYGDLNTHRIRHDMAAALRGRGYNFGKADNEETFRVMERSNFTLAPRGHGSTSFRMFEALQLLSVPVFVWDYDLFLPFQELVDWNRLAIVVHRKELATLPRRIEQFHLEAANELLRRHRHMWTYEFCNEYIVTRLQNEGCFPVPFSTWTDIPGRD